MIDKQYYYIYMVRKLLSLFLLLCFPILPSQFVTAAEKTLEFKASSNWVLSYEDDSCLLVRQFGEDKDQIILRLTRFGPGHDFRITLAGKPVRVRNNRRPYSIRFGEYEPEQKIEYGIGTLGKIPALIGFKAHLIGPVIESELKTVKPEKGEIIEYRTYDIDEERYAVARDIYLNLPFKKPMVLKTGSLAKPFAAFDKCVDELLTHWGIDVERHKAIAVNARPATPPERWMKSSDYPKKMLSNYQPGLVNFRLSVNDAGVATDCHIQQTTRPPEFDKAVCRGLMRRSKFHPALDSEGKPMASYYRNAVRFQIGY